jgi:hypothetical protein
MISFHESEHYNSPLGEDALRVLLSFLPREEYDKLLIGSYLYAGLDTTCCGDVRQVRTYANDPDYVIHLFGAPDDSEPEDKAATAEAPPLANSG